MNAIIEKVILKIALPVIALAAGVLIMFFLLDTRDTSKQNNGYVRVINCVISVPATVRTQQNIENCYEAVEKDLNITLQRYDTEAK